MQSLKLSETMECPLCLGAGELKRSEVLDRLGVKDFARVAQLSAEEAFRLLQQKHQHDDQNIWTRFETELARRTADIEQRHKDELYSLKSAEQQKTHEIEHANRRVEDSLREVAELRERNRPGLARDSVFRSDRIKKSLTYSEGKANIVVMQSPSNRKQLPGTARLSGTHKHFREGPWVRLRPEFVHPGCTNIELLLWSERGLSGNEDRQHFDCATWLHKAVGLPCPALVSRSDSAPNDAKGALGENLLVRYLVGISMQMP